MSSSEELFDLGFKTLFDVPFNNCAPIEKWLVIYDSTLN